MGRILLCTKDIVGFTGKSDRASRELLKKVRRYFNKSAHQPITVFEFADYLGIAVAYIIDFLK